MGWGLNQRGVTLWVEDRLNQGGVTLWVEDLIKEG